MKKRILEIFSWLALAATIVPSMIFLGGGMDLGQVKTWMLAATVVWFVTAPFWMRHKVGD